MTFLKYVPPGRDLYTSTNLLAVRSMSWFLKNADRIVSQKRLFNTVSVSEMLRILEERPEIMEKNPGKRLNLQGLDPKNSSTVPGKGKCRIILTQNTRKELILTWKQFQLAKDTLWYENNEHTIHNLISMRLEDYLGIPHGSTIGPYDFRPKEETTDVTM